jgi:hypothetical protein
VALLEAEERGVRKSGGKSQYAMADWISNAPSGIWMMALSALIVPPGFVPQTTHWHCGVVLRLWLALVCVGHRRDLLVPSARLMAFIGAPLFLLLFWPFVFMMAASALETRTTGSTTRPCANFKLGIVG